ncbi:MAG: hypothetical protein ABIH23_29560, partial [bacterium]
MTMLAEYALVPDIFDTASYSSPQVCQARLELLREPLLQEALVRDLRNGGWSDCIKMFERRQPYTKELMGKLVKQNRLRKSPSIGTDNPEDGLGWCKEAVASNKQDPLTGVITSSDTAAGFQDESCVASIEKLRNSQWWQQRSSSIRLCRNTNDYLRHLRLILGQANSIMFIDRMLDPTRPSYREFARLLLATQREGISPLIEIHRVNYEKSRKNQRSNDEWERRFRECLEGLLKDNGITVHVFIWDDLHDRYLITDIIGINLPNGFDIGRNPN